jgi:hypothetical protein
MPFLVLGVYPANHKLLAAADSQLHPLPCAAPRVGRQFKKLETLIRTEFLQFLRRFGISFLRGGRK